MSTQKTNKPDEALVRSMNSNARCLREAGLDPDAIWAAKDLSAISDSYHGPMSAAMAYISQRAYVEGVTVAPAAIKGARKTGEYRRRDSKYGKTLNPFEEHQIAADLSDLEDAANA